MVPWAKKRFAWEMFGPQQEWEPTRGSKWLLCPSESYSKRRDLADSRILLAVTAFCEQNPGFWQKNVAPKLAWVKRNALDAELRREEDLIELLQHFGQFKGSPTWRVTEDRCRLPAAHSRSGQKAMQGLFPCKKDDFVGWVIYYHLIPHK